jgi:hypothetical protein
MAAFASAERGSRSSGGMQFGLLSLKKKAGRHSGRFAPSAIGPMAATARSARKMPGETAIPFLKLL